MATSRTGGKQQRPGRFISSELEYLFHEALEQPGTERFEWLRLRCGSDIALFNELSSLLEYDNLESFAPWPAAAAAQLISGPSRVLRAAELGPYKILEFVAEGGMGMVYRANDPRTGRDVAIKVPKTLWTHRLSQEIRAAAALNHANICALYDVGPDYLVMELVEGVSPKGPLPLETAIDYARQIASALKSAHSVGVIHCDIKPSNIKVRVDGSIKVLDFGLAKFDPADACVAQSPESRYTHGVMGTVAYMSPEQIEGQQRDTRTDVWAFGAVLYELISGRPAFAGKTTADVIEAILNSDPDWAPIPFSIRPFLRRCLEKSPSRRLSEIGEFEVFLARQNQLRKKWLSIGLSALLIASAGIAIRRSRTEVQQSQPRVIPFTAYSGDESHPSFAPDGKRVVFTAAEERSDTWKLFIKDVGSGQATQLTRGPADDIFPIWAPNRRDIAFLRFGQSAGIWLASADQGSERKLMDFDAARCRPSWTPDSRLLVVARSSLNRTTANGGGSLYLVPVSGGNPVAILQPDSGRWFQDPAVSPDGRFLAFTVCTNSDRCDVATARLDPAFHPVGSPVTLAHVNAKFFGLCWAPDGRSVIYSASPIADVGLAYLWRVRTEGGAPERLEIASQGAWSPAVAGGGGRLVFARNVGNTDIWSVRPGKQAERILSSDTLDEGAQFSPDGKRIAFASGRGLDGVTLWVSDANGDNPLELTERGSFHRWPQWSPTGNELAFQKKDSDGHWHIAAVGLANRKVRQITEGPANDSWPAWSRDGEWVYFASDRSGTTQIWCVAARGGPARQLTTNGGFRVLNGPGNTLYYTKSADGEAIYARRQDGLQEELILSHVAQQAFSIVDTGIYYVDKTSSTNLQLRFYEFATRRIRTIASVPTWLDAGVSVAPDHKSFLYDAWSSGGSDLMLIENFR